MADNTTLPTTDTIATDDIGGVKYQRVKLIQGDDGINNGDISANNPLNTQLSEDNLQVLLQIRDYVAALQAALGANNELRTSLLSTTTLSSVAAVTTVATLTNQSQIGGYNASYYIANQMNMDYQSSNNINLVG